MTSGNLNGFLCTNRDREKLLASGRWFIVLKFPELSAALLSSGDAPYSYGESFLWCVLFGDDVDDRVVLFRSVVHIGCDLRERVHVQVRVQTREVGEVAYHPRFVTSHRRGCERELLPDIVGYDHLAPCVEPSGLGLQLAEDVEERAANYQHPRLRVDVGEQSLVNECVGLDHGMSPGLAPASQRMSWTITSMTFPALRPS